MPTSLAINGLRPRNVHESHKGVHDWIRSRTHVELLRRHLSDDDRMASQLTLCLMNRFRLRVDGRICIDHAAEYFTHERLTDIA